MKLLNYATAYFAALLLVVLLVWAGLFYYNMLDEIYDSMDDGLENQKILVLRQAARDSTVLSQKDFENGYYTVKELPFAAAKNRREVYLDTLMYMQNEKDYEPVRMLKTVFRQHDRYYELRVITSMVEEDDLIEDLLYSLLWLYLGLLTSILLLNNVLLRRIWQPFYQLLKALKSFRLADPKPLPPPHSRIAEFRLLHAAVDQLLQSNIDTFTSQKNFIENAAHELQTPVAISLNKLELLADHPNLQQDQLAQIGAITEHLQRLSRLNKSLLLLSKIENNQFETEAEVDINALLKKILADFSDQIDYRDLTLTVAEKGACRQRLNPDLAAILLLNLLKNAVLHNHPGGFIRVELRPDLLMIANSGQEKPLNAHKLFSRFYQESPSPAATGLGLAIAKAIADRYRFRLRYDYQSAHVITVHFKYPFA
jgi:signal transduction histidine kinase